MPTSNFDNTAETIYGWAGKFLDAILTVLTLALQGQKISRPKLEDTHKVGVGGGDYRTRKQLRRFFYHKRSFAPQSFNSTQSVPKIS